MGLLDDAIREHLELKRRRGADPTEVDRLEREALGPVRRIPESGEALYETQPADGGYEEAVALAPDTAPPEEWELEREEALLPGESIAREPAITEPEAPPSPMVESPPPAAAPAPPAAPPAPAAPPPEAAAPPPEAAPPPASAAQPPPPPVPPAPAPEPELGGETVEYDVEAEHADDDMLEETPEFLQDTPDHDRLWFEQRPPRDFDFDG